MTAFDPSEWLDRWEAAGGGYYVQDGRVVWCYLKGAENALTRLLFETHFRGRQDAVDAEMMRRCIGKEVRPVE